MDTPAEVDSSEVQGILDVEHRPVEAASVEVQGIYDIMDTPAEVDSAEVQGILDVEHRPVEAASVEVQGIYDVMDTPAEVDSAVPAWSQDDEISVDVQTPNNVLPMRLVDYSSSSEEDTSHVSPVDGDDDDMSAIFELPCLQKLDSPFVDRDSADSDGSRSPNGRMEDRVSQFVADDSDDGHDDSSSATTIQISSRDTNSKNRRLPCFFCDRWFFHMSRHLSGRHSEETAVAAASVPSPGRQLQMHRIINQGIYKHNVDVLQRKAGILVVGRAPRRQRSVENYVPCEFCLQFHNARELYRHCRRCKFRPANAPVNGFNVSGRALLHGSLADSCPHIDESLFNSVIQRMQSGRLLQVVKNDSLILELGSMLLEKLGNNRALDISARMRELARLVVQLRIDKTAKGQALNGFLSGENFDNVVKAIEAEAEPCLGPGKRKIFKKPGFVINVGSSVMKCAQLKRGRALRSGDGDSLKEAEDFMSLYTMSFTDRMASAAHASYRIKGNHLNDFPDEEDLRLLRKYQVNSIEVLLKAADDANETSFNWRELSEVTLSRILTFNARRGNEVAQLTLSEVNQAEERVDPSLAETLSVVEKELLQTLTVVNVVGKRSRPVPILLTPDMSKALQVLCDTDKRAQNGVRLENKFIFALPHSSGYLNVYTTLHRVAVIAGLKKPKLITTTRMRKHLATVAQYALHF